MDPVLTFLVVAPCNEGRGPETQRSPGARSWKDGTPGKPGGKPTPRSAERFLYPCPRLLSSEPPAPPLGAAPGLDPQGDAFGKGAI